MRILICGSRNFDDEQAIQALLAQYDPAEDTIIEGAAPGADTLAFLVGRKLGFSVDVYPADWNKYGRRAGYVRNKQMLDEGRPDIVHAFPVGRSVGTRMMIKLAQDAGVQVIVHEVTQ